MGTRWWRDGVLAAAVVTTLVVSGLASGCTSRSSEAIPTTAPENAPAPSGPTSGGTTPATTAVDGIAPDAELFTRQRAVLYDRDGDACDVCLWIADTANERSIGLMGVTTLGNADGMAFLYEAPTDTKFWMKGTLIELEIVFFDADGESVGGDHMTPCVNSSCGLYGPDTEFSTAVEFAVGHLAALGIADLARVTITDAPCDPGV